MRPFLFEIHLTANKLTNDRINDFERLCQKLGGKAILIELPTGSFKFQCLMRIWGSLGFKCC